MKWKYILDRNLQSAFIWASVALILLMTSLIENNRFTNLENSITSVYENRLVAKGYLYKLNSLIKMKESGLQIEQDFTAASSLDESINNYYIRYSNTELTREEAFHVDLLKDHLYQLIHQKPNSRENGVDSNSIYNSIYSELEILADIQITEGKKLVEQSTSTIVESRIVTGIEAFFLAGLIIYSFQYFSRKRFEKTSEKEPEKYQL